MTTKEKVNLPTGLMTKDELSKFKSLFDALEKDNQAYDFLTPVDFVGLGLDDYPLIVKNPMDVSTIKKNLKNNKYTNINEVFADIQLIWDNCRLYNMKGSDIYKMANHCEKLVKKLTDKIFKPSLEPTLVKTKREKASEMKSEDLGSEIEENENGDNLSYQEKVRLTESIRKLSSKGLSGLVNIIQKQRPQAIEDLDNEKLQIKIDLLDRKTLRQLETLIDLSGTNLEISDQNVAKKSA